ncbi:MAG: prolipoprotein diacylglyceryl transferase family protein [Byssovorax sp.]
MIPEIHATTLALGPIALHPFGLLLVAGVIAAHTALVRRARAEALAPPRVIEGFAIALGVGGLLIALGFNRLLGALGSLPAAAGAIVAGAVYGAAFHLDLLALADLAAWSFPFGWVFARLGCALVHDHLGPPSTSWLAVRFASGSRLDLGLLEWLLVPLLFAAILIARRSGRRGAIAGAVAIVYPLIRFPLDFLRESDARPLGLTAAQWATLPLFAAGVALLALVFTRPAPSIPLSIEE